MTHTKYNSQSHAELNTLPAYHLFVFSPRIALSSSSHGILPYLSVPRVWFKSSQFMLPPRARETARLFPSKSAFRSYIEPLSRATRPTMFCELWLQLAKEFDILGRSVSISVGVGHDIMGRDGIAARREGEGEHRCTGIRVVSRGWIWPKQRPNEIWKGKGMRKKEKETNVHTRRGWSRDRS